MTRGTLPAAVLLIAALVGGCGPYRPPATAPSAGDALSATAVIWDFFARHPRV